MLVVKEKVLRISNVLKLFLWNLGARGVAKNNNRSIVLTGKNVLYIQLFVLGSPDCRTFWDYELTDLI